MVADSLSAVSMKVLHSRLRVNVLGMKSIVYVKEHGFSHPFAAWHNSLATTEQVPV